MWFDTLAFDLLARTLHLVKDTVLHPAGHDPLDLPTWLAAMVKVKVVRALAVAIRHLNARPILNVEVVLVRQLDGCALVHLALYLVLDGVGALLLVHLRGVLEDYGVVLLVNV